MATVAIYIDPTGYAFLRTSVTVTLTSIVEPVDIVLLVSVSVVALPTKVSVEVGRVSVPVLTIDDIVGVVIVGEVDKTFEPDPVEVVTPVPPFVTGSIPITDEVSDIFISVLFEPLIDLFVSV